MGVDLGRIASSALEAALEDGQPKKKKHGGAVKAVVAGAALAVGAKAAASAATSKKSKLGTKLASKLVPTPNLDGLRDIPDRVRDWLDDDDGDAQDELDPQDLLDDDEQPVDDEDADEPVGEEDDDFDDEDDEEGEEDSPELLIDALGDEQDIDPAELPPKPPRSSSRR